MNNQYRDNVRHRFHKCQIKYLEAIAMLMIGCSMTDKQADKFLRCIND